MEPNNRFNIYYRSAQVSNLKRNRFLPDVPTLETYTSLIYPRGKLVDATQLFSTSCISLKPEILTAYDQTAGGSRSSQTHLRHIFQMTIPGTLYVSDVWFNLYHIRFLSRLDWITLLHSSPQPHTFRNAHGEEAEEETCHAGIKSK